MTKTMMKTMRSSTAEEAVGTIGAVEAKPTPLQRKAKLGFAEPRAKEVMMAEEAKAKRQQYAAKMKHVSKRKEPKQAKQAKQSRKVEQKETKETKEEEGDDLDNLDDLDDVDAWIIDMDVFGDGPDGESLFLGEFDDLAWSESSSAEEQQEQQPSCIDEIDALYVQAHATSFANQLVGTDLSSTVIDAMLNVSSSTDRLVQIVTLVLSDKVFSAEMLCRLKIKLVGAIIEHYTHEDDRIMCDLMAALVTGCDSVIQMAEHVQHAKFFNENTRGVFLGSYDRPTLKLLLSMCVVFGTDDWTQMWVTALGHIASAGDYVFAQEIVECLPDPDMLWDQEIFFDYPAETEPSEDEQQAFMQFCEAIGASGRL